METLLVTVIWMLPCSAAFVPDRSEADVRNGQVLADSSN